MTAGAVCAKPAGLGRWATPKPRRNGCRGVKGLRSPRFGHTWAFPAGDEGVFTTQESCHQCGALSQDTVRQSRTAAMCGDLEEG